MSLLSPDKIRISKLEKELRGIKEAYDSTHWEINGERYKPVGFLKSAMDRIDKLLEVTSDEEVDRD